MKSERWLTVAEMADRVGVTRRTLQRLAAAGRIAHHVIPGTNMIRFSPDDVVLFDGEAARGPRPSADE